ncbi:MAG: alpha/beta hydrolase [Planctomycetia bacterium]|nr:alpha/beta hydrolase [Planctomycetia bacterium]
MNEHSLHSTECSEAQGGVCPQTRQPCAEATSCHARGADAAPAAVALTLAETLARFDREAAWGECGGNRYFTWGQGPPLVFVPGLVTEARCFAPVCIHLKDRFRCIAYDLPTTPTSHAGLVADLLALLDHLHIAQAYLLGFSFGSTIALAALHQYPERFPRGVLVSGFARRRLGFAEVLLARLLSRCSAPMRRLPFHDAMLKRSHFSTFADRPPEVWQFFLERCGALPMSAVARRALLLHGVDLRPCLPAIRQPVQLVSGDRDSLVSGQCLDALQQGLPVNVHVELPHCGHYALFTHPADLADAIGRFLTPPTSACAPAAPGTCLPAPR